MVLAASTLAVFGRFQNYGPESAVRRFHDAVSAGNGKEIDAVVVGSARSSATIELQNTLRSVHLGRSRYSIVKSERSPTQVDMLTLYENKKTMVWVVTKERDHWRIDAYLTLQALRGLGY